MGPLKDITTDHVAKRKATARLRIIRLVENLISRKPPDVTCPNCGAIAGQKCKGKAYCDDRWKEAEKTLRTDEKRTDLRQRIPPKRKKVERHIKD